MKNEIDRLLNAENATLRINDFCTLVKETVTINRQKIQTVYVRCENSRDRRFPCIKRVVETPTYTEIKVAAAIAINDFIVQMRAKLLSDLKAGYNNGEKVKVNN